MEFPVYRLDSTYKDEIIIHDHCNPLAVLVFCAFLDGCTCGLYSSVCHVDCTQVFVTS